MLTPSPKKSARGRGFKAFLLTFSSFLVFFLRISLRRRRRHCGARRKQRLQHPGGPNGTAEATGAELGDWIGLGGGPNPVESMPVGSAPLHSTPLPRPSPFQSNPTGGVIIADWIRLGVEQSGQHSTPQAKRDRNPIWGGAEWGCTSPPEKKHVENQGLFRFLGLWRAPCRLQEASVAWRGKQKRRKTNEKEKQIESM